MREPKGRLGIVGMPGILYHVPMRLLRLRGRKICERVLKRGALLKGKTMHARVLWGAPRHPHANPAVCALYIGTIASTKLDKSAVRRNRMRRRCREAWRIALKEADMPSLASFQLLIAPRSISLSAPFDDIQRDVHTFLSSLRSWPSPKNEAATSSSSH
jgi:ribonuclease P protein component